MLRYAICTVTAFLAAAGAAEASESAPTSRPVVCEKADGYHGIWYAGGELPGEYRYQFSGGLATFSPQHVPMAFYAAKADKTFFVYGGMPADGHRIEENRRLLIVVSCFDHKTGMVPRPRILLDRQTDTPFENPTLAMDPEGYLWVFVGCHGTARPSYVFRSSEPYSIDSFSQVAEVGFSMPQPWHLEGQGFVLLHTAYDGPVSRLCAMTSRDGASWSQPAVLASIEAGHNHVSWRYKNKIGVAFDYCPKQGANNARTNLYYIETRDAGKTWGEKLDLPLTSPHNPAMVREYEAEELLVYVKDINYDAQSRPVILFVTSRGYEPGPRNDPRTWHIARWTGSEWLFSRVTESDNNYDTGSLYIETDGLWRIIGPTEPGPQRYNPGGEVAIWTSKDQGQSWTKLRDVTRNSELNHTYVRRPVDPHPDFYAFWADGHGRKPSESRLYFCNKTGDRVFRLPFRMEGEFAKPEAVR